MRTAAYASVPVQVRNLGGEPVGHTWLDRAIVLVSRGDARIVEADASRLVRSATGVVLKLPKVIELLRYIVVPFMDREEYFSPKGVLRRDKFTCGYCGTKKGTMTWDHIHPKSKGGQDTWMNSITACQKCNSMKGNLTLAEAEEQLGMKLLFEPTIPMKRYFKSGKRPGSKKRRN